MPYSQPTNSPKEAADRLAKALHENTVALSHVKRRSLWTILSVVVVALTLSITVIVNHGESVYVCERGNELRTELDIKFQKLADILDAAGTDDSPAGREVILTLEEKLTRRDCSDINWFGA